MTLFNTPMLKQYKQIKDDHPDTLLLFRLGDFYELFDADAIVAAQALSLTLTGRGKEPNRIAMCGMPYHAADKYVNQLIEKGFKVALCDQVGNTDDPGLTNRKVTQVLTPGTVSQDSMQSNFLMSLTVVDRTKLAYSFADISTGGICYCGWTTYAAYPALLARYRIKEVVIPTSLVLKPVNGVIMTQQPGATTEQKAGIATAVFGNHWVKRFGLDPFESGCDSITQLLLYSQDTQHKVPNHITQVYFQHTDDILVMNYETLDSLGLVNHKDKSSVFSHLNYTKTPMGARYLQYRLMNPYRSDTAMTYHWDSIQSLESYVLLDDIIAALTPIQDINRLATQLNNRRISPKDCVMLASMLRQAQRLQPLLASVADPQLSKLGQHIETATTQWMATLIDDIETTLQDDPPTHIRQGNAIRPGHDHDLDNLIASFQSIRDWIDQLESQERQNTGIKSLKVGYNKVFGYYIECPKQYSESVPDAYTRKQTLAQAERYVTVELKEKETILLTGTDQQLAREKALYDALLLRLSVMIRPIQALARVIGQLDVIQSLATVARLHGYTRPVIAASPGTLKITGGYHPILAAKPDTTFISNDLMLSPESGLLALITGPNMAGKSTLMRQVALCVIMAQLGGYVPASACEFSPADYLFTRIGASDNLYAGQSTFMVEMLESAAILNQATDKSLIILDEIGRGTATYDGLSIATAIAAHIHDKIKARTLFATHYHELVDRLAEYAQVRCYQMGIMTQDNNLVFTYKLSAGHTQRSYGIHVAAMAGLPQSVITHAQSVLDDLENKE